MTKRWLVAGAAAVVGLGTAVPVVNAAGGGGASPSSLGGMGSPDAAVEELLTSVRASDPLGLLAVLHPAERELVQTLYESSESTAESGGGVDVDALAAALHVEVETAALEVTPLADDLAWVTTASAELGVRLDDKAADAATVLDITSVEPYQGSFLPADDQLGIAVVKVGDDWFVSALYTAAEIGRLTAELTTQYVPAPATGAAASPTDALTNLLTAISAKDFAGTTAALAPFEAGLVADYESSIGAELLEALEELTVTFTADNVTIVEQDTQRAVLAVDQWSYQLRGADSPTEHGADTTLTVNGLCGELRSYDTYEEDYESSSGCAFEENALLFDAFSVLAGKGWTGPRLVAVNTDGAWTISVLQSVLYTLDELTDEPVTLAAAAEFAAAFIDVAEDGFYEAVFSLLGNGLEPLAVGEQVVPTSAQGHVAVFRIQGPAAFEVTTDSLNCAAFVHDDAADEIFADLCDAGMLSVEGSAVVTVAGLASPFSNNESLGEVTVNVVPNGATGTGDTSL